MSLQGYDTIQAQQQISQLIVIYHSLAYSQPREQMNSLPEKSSNSILTSSFSSLS